MDFSQPALTLARKVKAYNPWPGAYTLWQGQNFKIHRAHAVSAVNTQPGKHGQVSDLPAIAAVDGWLVLDEVQPAGKKPMPGIRFLHGARGWAD